MADVAARANVSRALVSIVMRNAPGASEATREKVRAAADALGYRPDPRARRLRQRRSNLIGVVFTPAQEFHAGLVDAVYVAADAAGYEVVLSCVTPRRDERRAIRTLLDDRCDALILIGSDLPRRELVALRAHVPVVVMARRVQGVDVVRSDDASGAGLAVQHLVGLGHRSIVYLDGGRAPGAAQRRRGFTRAVAAAGIVGRLVDGGLTEREGAVAAAALLADPEPPPTAIFAFNDRCALGVLDILIRHGMAIPDDVSVVGYDNNPLAGLAHIDLTTISQDTDTLAVAAIDRVVTQLGGVDVGGSVDRTSAPRLVIRGSTGAPRN